MTNTPRFSRFYQPGLAEKMDARVAVDPVTGCWEWTKGVNAEGYGNGLYVDGRQMRAHRVAYLVTHGYLPPSDVFICHLCSNPSCCRPDHLAPGTPWDNSQDTVAAGRLSQRRQSLRQRKADALAIQTASGTDVSLAARFGVSLSTVSRLRRAASRMKDSRAVKLTAGDVRAIRKSDEPNRVLAARYGVTAPNIHAVRLGRTWRHVL